MSALPTWPVMQTIGDESIIAVAMPVTMLVAPGPGGGDRDADLAGRARIAVGHVRRALLVADEDVADRVVEHRVVGRQNRAARIAEDDVDAFAHQAFPENLRTGQSFFTHSVSIRPITAEPTELRSHAPTLCASAISAC